MSLLPPHLARRLHPASEPAECKSCGHYATCRAVSCRSGIFSAKNGEDRVTSWVASIPFGHERQDAYIKSTARRSQADLPQQVRQCCARSARFLNSCISRGTAPGWGMRMYVAKDKQLLSTNTMRRLLYKSKDACEEGFTELELEVCRNTNLNRSDLSVAQQLYTLGGFTSSSDEDENEDIHIDERGSSCSDTEERSPAVPPGKFTEQTVAIPLPRREETLLEQPDSVPRKGSLDFVPRGLQDARDDWSRSSSINRTSLEVLHTHESPVPGDEYQGRPAVSPVPLSSRTDSGNSSISSPKRVQFGSFAVVDADVPPRSASYLYANGGGSPRLSKTGASSKHSFLRSGSSLLKSLHHVPKSSGGSGLHSPRLGEFAAKGEATSLDGDRRPPRLNSHGGSASRFRLPFAQLADSKLVNASGHAQPGFDPFDKEHVFVPQESQKLAPAGAPRVDDGPSTARVGRRAEPDCSSPLATHRIQRHLSVSDGGHSALGARVRIPILQRGESRSRNRSSESSAVGFDPYSKEQVFTPSMPASGHTPPRITERTRKPGVMPAV
ncbi:hypothetical protein FVE85_2642 [Porphyridium purpureum]|uniref:Uncharacterized protein n=1 Tax=Porphyridium purpureum TaxID=35688 RepID=A0A5J4YSC4_PORPP|nr:hypothetical protein FVE85_2642 [Porphyridium purpureum]|eukprot:POR0071..scf227_4